MLKPFVCFFMVFFCSHGFAMAQDTTTIKETKNRKGEVAKKLKQSLSADDELATAQQYESLANELIKQGDYEKAESYLIRSQVIYQRHNEKKRLSTNTRNLAKVQENLNKKGKAIENYKSASKFAGNKDMWQANQNDANRLRTGNSANENQTLAEKNVALFEKNDYKEELSDAYSRVAESQVKQGKQEDAAQNLRRAMDADPESKIVPQIAKEVSKAYLDDKKVDKAIAFTESVLKKSEKQKNTAQQIEQLQDLAALYKKDADTAKSKELLQEAYQLALQSGNTIQAKNAVMALAQQHLSQHNNKAALELLTDYLNRMDSLLKFDSTLIDNKVFEATEGRIKELEEERALQNELMARKTTFNYFLIAGVVLLTLLAFFIARALIAIGIKNKKIALQSLRREMNPHFIFNSLNSVNQFIAENNELEANKYLTNYSGLMRNVMENANKDYVTLRTEIEQLKKYLELEHQRFHDQFDYDINADEQLDWDSTWIPNMLIQPNLENAIWHGLRYKQEKGNLQLNILKDENLVRIEVKDNGIGLTKSSTLKTSNQKSYKSRGLQNTKERIALLNSIYKTDIKMQMAEIDDADGGGTLVTLEIPQTKNVGN